MIIFPCKNLKDCRLKLILAKVPNVCADYLLPLTSSSSGISNPSFLLITKLLEEGIGMRIIFDEKNSDSYCHYKCLECGSGFYWGLTTIHNYSCSQGENDWGKCVKVVGPVIVEKIKKWAREEGEEKKDPLSDISLRELKEQLPQLF